MFVFFFNYDCGMMELWDGSRRFSEKNMPEYSTVSSFYFYGYPDFLVELVTF